MVEDAAEAQRSRGLIPQVRELKSYITDVVERVEKQRAQRKVFRSLPERPKPAVKGPDELEREYHKRLRRAGLSPIDGKWQVERKVPKKTRKRFAKVMSYGDKMMRARIRLLAQHPDWAARLKRINPLVLQGQLGEFKRRHAESEIRQIILDSERVFGPWYKEPVKPLIFT